jgi:NAD(P)-dependent dehydrogenase (short-subunit alcohol dehydrogenase family)
LRLRLEPLGIGVTVVCPGFIKTSIMDAGRNRQARYGPWRRPDPASPAGQLAAQLAEGSRTGMDPMALAARVLKAIRDDELYVFTHPEWRAEAEQRFAAILAALDRTPAR